MTDTTDTQLKAAINGLPRRGRPPGQEGTLNRDIHYICEVCNYDVGRNLIFVREVTFIRLADKTRVRTRRTQWICAGCMVKEPDYNRQRYTASPGMRDINAKG